jgi:hypothetical protein
MALTRITFKQYICCPLVPMLFVWGTVASTIGEFTLRKQLGAAPSVDALLASNAAWTAMDLGIAWCLYGLWRSADLWLTRPLGPRLHYFVNILYTLGGCVVVAATSFVVVVRGFVVFRGRSELTAGLFNKFLITLQVGWDFLYVGLEVFVIASLLSVPIFALVWACRWLRSNWVNFCRQRVTTHRSRVPN